MNWSRPKKFFVTAEIVLLTFSVYIGSAIYTPGVEGVMEKFGVSQVAATLGLTTFVAGYGLGPLIWSPLSEIPQFGRNPDFLGPAALTLAQRYNLDSRDQGSAERMPYLNAEQGVWACTFVGYCSEVCPKEVDPAAAINQGKVASDINYAINLVNLLRGKHGP